MSLITYARYEETLRDWLGKRAKFRPNWRDANSAGGFDAHGVMHHWDAIKSRDPLYHCRVLEDNGDLGLSAHISPARNGDVYILAGPHANANHAGRGDSRVYRAILEGTFDGSMEPGWNDFDGNEVFYGFEYQFHPDEGEMTDEQIEGGVLAAAALCEAHGWSPTTGAGSNLDHYEWTDRKWDRDINNLANRTRERIKVALIDGPPKEDDMDADQVHAAVWKRDGTVRNYSGPHGRLRDGENPDVAAFVALQWAMNTSVRNERALVEVNAKLNSIVEAMSTQHEGLAEKVEQAVKKALEEATVDVDVTVNDNTEGA